ncbi:nucleotidyltransferase domain-containing protein [Parablautia muri]|uniref:nucleotidyltransferase domain-containing protein n=1 Tax=Parablautia muri TaxID=2320879 RepID=UPI002412193E|nr:nucleotidyltransferase domain-containing protein [Parablautia muri]
MQKRVQKILEELSGDSNLKKIVLYGNSLEFSCNSNSDIDLYIEKFNKNLPLEKEPVIDCEVDIITNLNHKSRLYEEIDRTGLRLYESKDSGCRNCKVRKRK